MRRLFGTDGIRAIAGQGALAPETIMAVAKAVGALLWNEPQLFSRQGRKPRSATPRALLALDTRSSGHMIQGALVAGLLASGVDVLEADVLPAPACAYLTRRLRCDVALFVSASHNPNDYNGIKLFDRDGFKATTALERRIEELVFSEHKGEVRRPIGRYERVRNAQEMYAGALTEWALSRFDLRGRTVVLDCANGAVSHIAPVVFNRLGAELRLLNATPDGRNINRGGALFPKRTSSAVKRSGAFCGFCFDGDGDRVIPVAENGAILDGDFAMAILALDMLRRRRLPHRTVVSTVMSNMGFEVALRKHNIKVLRTGVGDRLVLEKMLETGARLGGEQSGHLILLKESTTGDGILAALALTEVMVRTNKHLSELAKVMRRFPQVLINVPVSSKPPLQNLPPVQKAVKEAERLLGSTGRLLLRYSGTEPVARVMAEGENRKKVKEAAELVADAIKRSIGSE